MPGMSSGLAPELVWSHRDDWSQFDREFVPLCKFPTAYTITDFFAMVQTALTTNTSTTHMRVVYQDRGTTGNQTGAIGVISQAWVAYTAGSRGTNYTQAANEYTGVAFSEAGTIDLSQSIAGVWAVNGNV